MKTVLLLSGLFLISTSLSAQLADPPADLPNWDLKVYPNPTSDLLIVSSSVDIKDITLIDLNGQVIKNRAMPNWCFSLHDLPQGWIFVYIESMDGRIEKKNVYKN